MDPVLLSTVLKHLPALFKKWREWLTSFTVTRVGYFSKVPSKMIEAVCKARVKGLQYRIWGGGSPNVDSNTNFLWTAWACSIPIGVSSGSAEARFKSHHEWTTAALTPPYNLAVAIQSRPDSWDQWFSVTGHKIQITACLCHSGLPYFSNETLSASRKVLDRRKTWGSAWHLRHPSPWRDRRKNLYSVLGAASLFSFSRPSKNLFHLSFESSINPNRGGT
jgi:hypothetical protein